MNLFIVDIIEILILLNLKVILRDYQYGLIYTFSNGIYIILLIIYIKQVNIYKYFIYDFYSFNNIYINF
ncbi:hypothetical protein JSCD14_02240 [Clostridioides difficile]|nr:hypothetical protein TNHP173_13250 [Clostridioides difficile]GMK62153.1 hypothetical protein JSCD1_20410 [Clostridioides difficile]GMK64194.1 hypothetical protein JSCD2_05200 [Clostridioides difficile]GMK68294.1 hypothetical protein JSCD3_10880 [Clostridioides difficile]GMK71065.1 hypothetical protein JSCD4_02320 [Clostridioides difficile]